MKLMQSPFAALLAFSVLMAASADAAVEISIVRPDGTLVSSLGARGPLVEREFCVEAEDLDPPSCSDAPGGCAAEATNGACVRPGFLFRLTFCADPGSNPHEGHPFSWSKTGALPPSLALVDPFGTSTAYVGGNFDTVPPAPPFHNGKHFGLLTEPFCGAFTVNNQDTCPFTELHGECGTAFMHTFRTLDVDPAKPLPRIDGGEEGRGVVGLPFEGEILASGGTENFIFSLASGEVPNGIDVNANGTITGTPTEAGTFTFSVRVEEDENDPIFENPEACAAAPRCSTEVAIANVSLVIAATATSSSTTTTTTTTSTSTTTTSSTTLCPFPNDVCGQPVNLESAKPNATDCLYILQTAIGLRECCLCPCDVDSNGAILATDALRCLQNAIGVNVDLQCVACPLL